MEALWQDLRISLRHLVRDPRTSVVIVLCAALAIGLNSSIFNIAHAFVLRPPAVENPDELVRLYGTTPGFEFASLSYPNYTDLRDGNEVFSDLAAYSIRPSNLTVRGETEQVNTMLATGNYFAALGVEAARGRLFTSEDDQVRGGHPVMVIGHRLWQSHFGGDPEVIGEKVLLNGQPFTVTGIVPRSYAGNIPGFVIDLWVPMQMQPVVMPSESHWLDGRGQGWLSTFARLRPGVTAEQAEAHLDLLTSNLREANPGSINEGWQVAVYPGISPIPPNIGSVLQASSMVGLVLVFCVLLIACANVASLLLARAEARQKEISIRLAIGAHRGRLVRQLLTESLLLSVAGGGLGILIAIWTSRVFPTLIPSFGVPIEFDTAPDATVLGFTLGLTIVTGCLFGLVPALQASKPDLVPTLKGETGTIDRRRRLPLRQALVAFQVAVSMLLLVGAGLFIRSLEAERQVDPGFNADSMLVAKIDPSLFGYDGDRGMLLFDDLRQRVAELPGVQSVAYGEIAPLTFANSQQWSIEVEGYEPAPNERMNLDYNIVGDSYFDALEVEIVAGRAFARTDNAEASPVIIVNQTTADRYWGGDALGQRIRTGSTWREVVGVAADGKYRTLREESMAYMYLPLRQTWQPAQEIFVRTAGDPIALLASARAALREIDPNLPFTDIRTLEQHAEGALFLSQMGARVIGLFGGLALVLATIGLFGLLSHAVVRRTREIGIRMSLGADRRDVFSQLLREGLKLTTLGLVAGLVAALAVGRMASGLLFGLSGTDPRTFVTVTFVLLATSILAIAIPALRATRISPVVALRYE
ncbi:MAG: ABC transporter permease [Acidobacteriota bacterium]